MAFGSILEAALIGAFFLVPFSHLWGQLPPIPPPSAPAASQSDWTTAIGVALVFGLPSLLPFGLLLRLPPGELNPDPGVRLSRLATGALVGLILLPALVSMATYPCCTSDVLDYVNRQRLWVVYGGNPFSLVPEDHPEDWSYYFANFKSTVFGYGPAWWLIARLFTHWATTLDEYLVGFKLLAAVSFGVSAALIWRLADARVRLLSLAFFAWNPAVLIEGLVRGQNDLMTVPFVLGAVWLVRHGRAGAALAVSAAGALVKVTVAPLWFPIAATLIRGKNNRGRLRSLAAGGLASCLLVGGLYAPFWFGPDTLAPLLVQANRPQWSLGSILLLATGPWLGEASVPVVRLLLGVLCVGLMAAYLVRMKPTTALPDSALVVMLIGLLCLPMAFYSHYLMPAVGLAAIASDSRLRLLVLVIGFGAMVNAVLGVDTFAGGPSGTVLDVTGSLVLIVAVALGLYVAQKRARPRLVPAG